MCSGLDKCIGHKILIQLLGLSVILEVAWYKTSMLTTYLNNCYKTRLELIRALDILNMSIQIYFLTSSVAD